MGRALAVVLLLAGAGWAGFAVRFDAPLPAPASAALGASLFAASPATLLFLRPFARAALVVGGGLVAVAAWWLHLAPSNDRDWQPDVARLPRASVNGSVLTVENVRDFHYRTESDFDEHWETRSWDLDRLEGVDFFLSYWGPRPIAHTIVSWTFEDAPPLAISIETRKERGEGYSALRGLFRQYELYYVVADEADVVRLRTAIRGEEVYRYRVRLPRQELRALLLDYVEGIDALAARPRWYNALTQNCTTTIRYHLKRVAPGTPFDWRILANGYIDERMYERGTIAHDLPFAQVRARARIGPEAGRAPEAEFSRTIRRIAHDPADRARSG